MVPLAFTLFSSSAQTVIFLIFYLEVFGSDLGRDTDYIDSGFSPSSSAPPEKFRVHTSN
jgi:hypothetical protein